MINVWPKWVISVNAITPEKVNLSQVRIQIWKRCEMETVQKWRV